MCRERKRFVIDFRGEIDIVGYLKGDYDYWLGSYWKYFKVERISRVRKKWGGVKSIRVGSYVWSIGKGILRNIKFVMSKR